MQSRLNMNKKSIAIVVGVLMVGSFHAFAIGNKGKAQSHQIQSQPSKLQCQPFQMNQVHLLPSRFQENMKRDSAWMMSIPVGSLLQSFRNTSGAFSSREGGYIRVKTWSLNLSLYTKSQVRQVYLR